MSSVFRHSDGSYKDFPEEDKQYLAFSMGPVLGEQTIYYTEVSVEQKSPKQVSEAIVKEIEDHKSSKVQGGTKHDSNKPRTELIPTEFTIEVAKALTFGANKYSEDNFKNGISYRRLLGAAKRHIELELCKIDCDSESDLSHLSHAGASLAMYAFMKTHRPDLDDRYEYTEEQKKKIEEMMYGEKK